MSDRQVYRCFFFLSLIMNFFCPPRLALATREPGENCQSSSENLQMLIQVFIPVELSSFSVFSVFDSISSRFSLLYSAREEEILDCGSSSSLLARELKERKKYSYCFVFVPALEHNTRFALASCTQKKKNVWRWLKAGIIGIFQPPNYSTWLITMGITYREALITRAAFKLFTVVNLRFQLSC